MIYDIFYISESTIHDQDWKKFRQRFPISQKIENVKSFEDVRSRAFTKFFYVVWDGTEVLDFNFDYKVLEWDEQYIHVWKTLRNHEETYQSGITLFPKNVNLVSSREFANRFYLNKKEIDLITSRQVYPQYIIDSYDQYKEIIENTNHDMFWLIWNNITKIDSDIFNLYFDPNNGQYDYDRNENHVFKNGCADNESYLNGIVLCSKNKIFSKKEFDRKYIISKKEHEEILSRFKYPIFSFSSYDEYVNAIENVESPLFWFLPNDVEVLDPNIFNFYFDPNNGKYDYDRDINHVFKNDQFYDGLILFSKNKKITKKEFDFRFFITKKEWDNVVSRPKPYDIFFISYNEPQADENYQALIKRFPRAKRIHGIKGIHNAHRAAAEQSETPMFWVVDADAIIEKDFNFEVEYYPHYDSGNRREFLSTVRVWFSKNPINDLVYGYGGVKLLPTKLTLEMNVNSVDMTTSISDNFKVVSTVSNITAFNTDPFNTWKSAFRECAKLASKVIDSDYDPETDFRLGVWCSKGEDALFGKYAIGGAIEGRSYGYDSIGDNRALQKINDFNWLKDRYETWLKNNEQ